MAYVSYSTFINQIGVYRAGLAEQTDYPDWAILSYLKERYLHASTANKIPIVYHNSQNYVEVNYRRLINHMPLLNIKHKGNISKRFKKLKKLGLLITTKDGKNRLFFKLTQRALDIINYKEHKPNLLLKGANTESCSKATGMLPQNNSPESCPKATHSSIISSKSNSRKKKKQNSEKISTSEKIANIKQTSINSLSFEEKFKNFLIAFWTAFPKRSDGLHHYQTKAEQILRKIAPEKWQLVLQAVTNYKHKSTKSLREGVIFHAVNWLKNWEIYIPVPATKDPVNSIRKQQQQKQQEEQKKQEELAGEKTQKLQTLYNLLAQTEQQQIHQQTLKKMMKIEHVRNVYRKVEKEGKDPLERSVIQAIYLDYRNEILQKSVVIQLD